MRLNPNSQLLGCLNSNGCVFVVNVDSLCITHVFPNAFRRGETVANFCFSFDGSRIMILGTRNGYYVASLHDDVGRQPSDCTSNLDGEKDGANVKGTRCVSSGKALCHKRNIQAVSPTFFRATTSFPCSLRTLRKASGVWSSRCRYHSVCSLLGTPVF